MPPLAAFSQPECLTELEGFSWDNAEDAFALPAMNEWGLLPRGIHETTLGHVENRFTFSKSRVMQWQMLLSFLDIIKRTGDFSHLYVAGAFVTDKAKPTDVDVILETRAPFGAEAYRAMEPLFRLGVDAVYKQFGVHLHFWSKGFPREMEDFRKFFQTVRPSEVRDLHQTDCQGKGIIRIAL